VLSGGGVNQSHSSFIYHGISKKNDEEGLVVTAAISTKRSINASGRHPNTNDLDPVYNEEDVKHYSQVKDPVTLAKASSGGGPTSFFRIYEENSP
jgi:alanine dehydrogenase